MRDESKFYVGQLVSHNKFNYRGVIVDVDQHFMMSDDWYEKVAKSRPPKDQPWYRVLVHGAVHQTYVAERHLDPALSDDAIVHPDIGRYLGEFRNDHYVPLKRAN